MSPNSDAPQPDTIAPGTTAPAGETTDSYARKLSLALMSVLRDKGLLDDADLHTILMAVDRSVRAEREALAGRSPKVNPGPPAGSPPPIDMEL